MHELSLALEVIDVASQESEKNHVTRIVEIRIEVGRISGVDTEAFSTALSFSKTGTILEKAEIILVEIPGKGRCSGCGYHFEMKELWSACPACGKAPSEILSGREFRISSMLAE